MKVGAILVIAICFSGSPALAGATFTPLGDLPGGNHASSSWAVSDDGRVVAGASVTDVGPQAFRWEQCVLGPLEPLPASDGSSTAWGLSADGSIVVGSAGILSSQSRAVRWVNGTIEELGGAPPEYPKSAARATSADGSVIVGQVVTADGHSARGIRWEGESAELLATLPSYAFSHPAAITRDGLEVLGYVGGSTYPTQAVIWEGGTAYGLGGITSSSNTRAAAASDEGTVVGTVAEDRTQAYRWTSSTGFVPLGDLEGGYLWSRAYAITADGAVVVGSGYSDAGTEAVIWDDTGIHRFQELLENQYGLELPGWQLEVLHDISADGNYIVGDGINPDGDAEAFLVSLDDDDADGDGIRDACDAPCADGLDNDGDGATDFPEDPGCRDESSNESPACDDGIDNDGDGGVDWDGAGLGAADPDCRGVAWRGRERPRACGLGFELALLLPVLASFRRHRRTELGDDRSASTQ